MGRTHEVTLPKTWDTASAMPATLYVEGVAPSASMRDIELKLEYDENVDGENRDIFKCSDKVTLTAVKISLKEVSFSGNSNHTIKSDDGLTDYSAPHWQDNSMPLDGDADDIGDIKYPICYTRSSKMKAQVLLGVEPSAINIPICLCGDGLNNYDFPNTNFVLSGSSVLSPVIECANAFANHVDFINSLSIEWKYAFSNSASWVKIGESKNPCYITLGDPNVTPYITLVHIGCANALGETTGDPVVQKIWQEFSDLSVRRVSDMHTLTYYKTPYDPNCPYTVEGLLREGDGRCGAWARFLRDAIKVQGISGAIVVEIVPIDFDDLLGGILLVKNQDLSPLTLTPPQPPIPTEGIAGQGCADPSQSIFVNHAVVLLGTKIYDPSYGSLSHNLLDWQRNSLDAIRYFDTDGNNVYLCDTGATWPLLVRYNETEP